MTEQWMERNGVRFLTFPHLEVPHAVSSRVGGISEGPYASLNLGKMSGDALDRVTENRRLFGQAVGFPTPYSVRLEHGAEVVEIVEAEEQSSPPPADGCVTNRPGVPLTVTTADCVSILFYDPVRKAIGAAHAGWKGTLLGVAPATVKKMTELYGSRPSDVRVALGPAIQSCCFEVDDEVAGQFREPYPQVVGEGKVAGKWQVDLHAVLVQTLREAGVAADHLKRTELCTSCRSEDFFSYRRDRGQTGRMAAAICLPATVS